MASQTHTDVHMEELEETEYTRQESCQMWYQTILGKNLREQQPWILESGGLRGYAAGCIIR